MTRNIFDDIALDLLVTDACVEGAACPLDCAAECDLAIAAEAPTCPRCGVDVDPLEFACPGCAHNPFSRLEGRPR